jgi:hypothetical protein
MNTVVPVRLTASQVHVWVAWEGLVLLDSAVLRMDIVALVPGFAPRLPRLLLLLLPRPLLLLHLLRLRLRQALRRLISGISVVDRGGAVGLCVLLLTFARIIVFGTLSASEGAPIIEYMKSLAIVQLLKR